MKHQKILQAIFADSVIITSTDDRSDLNWIYHIYGKSVFPQLSNKECDQLNKAFSEYELIPCYGTGAKVYYFKIFIKKK
jgi:hypothetical protein